MTLLTFSGRAPPGRRILAGTSVHCLAEQVRVPGVPAILLDHVAQEAPQAGMPAVWPRRTDQLTGPAAGQRRGKPRPGPRDGAVPERVELGWRVIGGGGELLFVAAVAGVPR